MDDESRSILQCRTWKEVNTDPQRRCYDGCRAKSEMRWTAWSDLETDLTAKMAARLKFWKELNEYAVRERGKKGTFKKFRIIPVL